MPLSTASIAARPSMAARPLVRSAAAVNSPMSPSDSGSDVYAPRRACRELHSGFRGSAHRRRRRRRLGLGAEAPDGCLGERALACPGPIIARLALSTAVTPPP